MKKILLLMLLVGASGTFLHAQNYDELNGPYGGEIRDLVKVGSAVLGSVPGQGIVRSTDGGAVWEESNSGINDYYINDLEFDPVSGKVYALAERRLFSSSDEGLNWIVEASSGFFQGKFVQRSADYFYIVTHSGQIYRSIAGANWSLVYTLPTNNITAFEVSAAGNLFVSTRGSGLYRSTDDAVSFTQLDEGEGLTHNEVTSISIAGSDIYVLTNGGPFKSTNNGTTWTSLKSATLTDTYFYDGVICKTGSTLYIFHYFKVWTSADDGATWSTVPHPLQNYGSGFGGNIQSSLVESASLIYLSIWDVGIFKTTDGGLTWTERNNGITGHNADTPGSLLYVPANNRLLYATSYPFGFYISIDDGASWNFVNTAPNDQTIAGFRLIGSTIYAFGNGLNKSTDNAQTWTEVHNGDIASCPTGMKVLVNTDANTFYSYTDGDCSAQGHFLLKSLDAGVNWTRHAITSMPSRQFSYIVDNNFHADAAGNLYILIYNYTSGVNKSQLYKIDPATNAASLVTNIGSAFSIEDIDSRAGKIYVLTRDSRLHISSDAATTWTSKTTTHGFGKLRIVNDNTFYILHYQGAMISTDGGASWSNSGDFGHGRNANDVVLSPDNHSYIQVDFGRALKSKAPVIPPAAPADLVVHGFSEDDVALTWTDNSDNEDYFIIERSANTNASYDSVGTASRFDDAVQNFVYKVLSGHDPETQYFYRVRASSAGGTSAYTNEVSFTTLADCRATSDIPLNRSWTATTLNESGVGIKTDPAVTIKQWSRSDGYYLISNLNIGSTAAIHSDDGAAIVENCGSVFMYGSRDIQRNNGTWDSQTQTLTIQWQSNNPYAAFQETTTFQLNATDPVPAPPTNVSAYVKTQNEIVVSWQGTDFAQQYQLQRSNTSGTDFVNVGAPVDDETLLQIDNTTLTLGATYYYRVIATGLGGPSAPSAEAVINFQTPLFDAISLEGFDYSTQGVAWADIDSDNDEDLLVSPFVSGNSITAPIQVYENLGDGSLQLLTVAGLSDLETTTFRSISVGDINNDDKLDLLTNGTDPAGGDIFINKGNYEFQRVSLVPPSGTGLNWYGELVDFNNDGRLDAVFSDNQNTSTSLTPYSFFTQNAEGGFQPYEIGEIVADVTWSRGGSWADYDNDGDPDFLRSRLDVTVADFDQLYQNNGDGTFTPVAGSAFEQDYEMSPRTISWADFDNDLDLDVFIGHNFSGHSNMLYENNGDGTFSRLTTNLLAQPKTNSTYGSSWGDVDNDGDQDLVLANNLQSELFLNDGTGVFSKYSAQEYLVARDVSRANIAFAMADFDNNGTLDIATGKFLVSSNTFPTILLKNNLVPGADTHWLKIKLNGTTTNRSGIGARIVVTTPDNKKQMRAISTHTGYGSCNSLIAHFGLNSNTTVSSIEVHWPSGIVQNMSPQNANQMITITEDGAGPAGTLLSPLNNAENVPVNANLEITFDEAPIAQPGKKLSFYISSDLSIPVFQIDAAAGVVNINQVAFDLPADLQQLTSYTAVLEPGAYLDMYGNPSPEILWTFTTTDAVKPQIQFDAPLTVAKGSATTFSPVVSDNSSVSQVILHYRKISAKDYSTLAGTLNTSVANQYDFVVSASFFDETGLEYYFTATDPAMNETRSPETGSHKTYLLYDAENTSIPTLGFGGDKNDWKIFSIPFELDDNAIASIFEEVINNTELEVKYDYAILSYKDQTAWNEYPAFTTIERGQGYFINIVTPLTVRVGADLIAPQNDQNNLFTIDLKQGWNMIGNPYLSAISWTDVAALNGLTGTAAEIKKYFTGQYSTDDQDLQPYEGAFVHAAATIPDVMIPFKGQTSTGGRKGFHNLSNDIDADAWRLKLNLRQGTASFNLGAIGMVPDASASFDDYDDITPPRLFDYLEMNFIHPEFFSKRFSRDIVPTQESYSWDFEVDSNLTGMAELSWDQTALLSADNEIYLLDIARYKLIDMKASGSYRFDPKGSRHFAIHFGKDPEIASRAVGIGNAYPNPTDGLTTIGFSLTESGGTNQNITLEIMDALGRKVATVAQGIFNPGYHEVHWDCKEMTSGFYTYRLSVHGRKGKEIHVRKLIIK